MLTHELQLNPESKDRVLEYLTNKYARFFELGLALSGVQFIGLTMEFDPDLEVRISYFLLALCCLGSLFSATMASTMVKFLGASQFESVTFVITALTRYKLWFLFAEFFPFINSIVFLLTVNLMVHSVTTLIYALVFHLASGILAATAFGALGELVFKEQRFRLEDGTVISRRVSSGPEEGRSG